MKKEHVVGLVAAGIVALAAISALSAEPRVSFVSDRDAGWAIYSASADGADLRRVVSLPDVQVNAHFTWTSDGSRIAFVDRGRIMRMTGDGRSQTQVTEESSFEAPAWSPDGEQLAMTAARDITGTTLFGLVKKRAKEIYTVSAGGGSLTRLTNNTSDDYSPAWSPDGGRIAFVSKRDGNSEIYVMNANGSGQSRITNNRSDDESPAWSPDGKRLAYSSQSGGTWVIKAVNVDGSDQVQIAFDELPCTSPAWSPDGDTIAYLAGSSLTVASISEDYEGRTLGGSHATDLFPAWVGLETGPIRPYQLSGRVVERGTNRSVPAIKISFSNGRRSVITDKSGGWWKPDFTEAVTVTPSKEGWLFEPRSYQVIPDIEGRVTSPGIVFEGVQYYSVRGAVVDPKGKGIGEVVVKYRYRDTLKNADVTLYALTDDSGEFSLPDVMGVVSIGLMKAGWVFDAQETRVAGATSGLRMKGIPEPPPVTPGTDVQPPK